MDNAIAFLMGEAHRNCEMRVFDWDKAARIIRERKPEIAAAGLSGDLEWTGGIIYEEGEPVKNRYTFLASTWAMPVLVLDEEEIECFVMESKTKWNEKTKWPDSALKILKEENP